MEGITVGMLCKNEGNRYLRNVLNELSRFAESIVILDNGSDDSSLSLYKLFPKIRLFFDFLPFSFEKTLRNHLLECIYAQNPKWILILDADELISRKFFELEIPASINWLSFPLFCIWKPYYYRTDGLWKPTSSFRMFLAKKRLFLEPELPEQACGHIPRTILRETGMRTSVPLYHFAYLRTEDRISHYNRYKSLNYFGHLPSHIESILKKPQLKRLEFEEPFFSQIFKMRN
jgi:glycosyltransferase involved in cell wall biosynthesis